MTFYLFPKREFSLLLLPLLTRKLKRTVPTLLMRPSLLAHTIYQALAFDAALSEAGFGLSETSAGKVVNPQEVEDKWGGVSEVILGNKQWFDSWMEGERKCKCILDISTCDLLTSIVQSLRTSTTRSSVRLMHGLLLTRIKTRKMFKGN